LLLLAKVVALGVCAFEMAHVAGGHVSNQVAIFKMIWCFITTTSAGTLLGLHAAGIAHGTYEFMSLLLLYAEMGEAIGTMGAH